MTITKELKFLVENGHTIKAYRIKSCSRLFIVQIDDKHFKTYADSQIKAREFADELFWKEAGSIVNE